MLLLNLLEELVAERPVARITEEQYRRSVRCFSRFLGRPAELPDLEHATVNLWLASLASGGAAPRTVLGRKRGLTPVWNYATERGQADGYNSRRLRRIRVPDSVVDPWSLDDVAALFRAARQLPGRTNCGIPASLLMSAVCSLAYETGIRPSDWRILGWDSIDWPNRLVRFVQHKTGKPHTVAFSQVTEDLLRQLQAFGRSQVVPVGKPSLRRWERVLFTAAASIGFRRRKGQALGTLRKSHATSVFLRDGESAAANSLGHISGTAIARKHYIATSANRDPVRIEIPHARSNGLASDRQEDRRIGKRPRGVAG